MALINGRVVGVGDIIGDFSVIQILTDKVVLKKGNKEFVLKFKKED